MSRKLRPVGSGDGSGGGAEGESPATPTASAPRLVIRGANCKHISVDWVRLSGPRSQLPKILSILEKQLGRPEKRNGRFMLEKSYRWLDNTVSVHFDEDDRKGKEWMVVELTGSVLQEWGSRRTLSIVREIMQHGFKGTRVDLALDLRGDGIDLIERVERACERRELCKARVHGIIRKQCGPEVQGETVYLGKRGKEGSGRCVRVYDKGLETATAPRGRWVRWECEFADTCAREVLMALVMADDGWGELALGFVLGAVEFREFTGRQHLKDRPLVKWWADFVAGVKLLTVRAHRTRTTLQGWSGWLATAVVPKLEAFAHRLRVEPWELVRTVTFGEVRHAPEALRSLLWRELSEAVSASPAMPSH